MKLGNVDPGAMPADKAKFLSLYHATLADSLKNKQKFRDEGNSVWCDFEEIGGAEISVRELQQFLKDAGFMPKANMDGVFGYGTQAAVRLFQEYLRSVEGNTAIGTPDGVVGPNTLKHIKEWQQRRGTEAFVCDWGKSNAQNPSTPEFTQWIQLLSRAKSHFQSNPSPLLRYMESYSGATDTRKINDWDVSPDTVHLIGLRSGQETFSGKRDNDDLFVLLIKGMVFKFWGSTDPASSKQEEMPFLVEGQHLYQFGWHKIRDEITVYRALKPASAGVLVYRDKNRDKALTDEDVVRGLEAQPNPSINIHWSGIGRSNFSEGCQVMAGKSYINHKGNLVSCSAFAAASYEELGARPVKTRGAYNVFTDLVLNYAPAGVYTIAYTLGRDETLRLSDVWNQDFVRSTVEKMKAV